MQNGALKAVILAAAGWLAPAGAGAEMVVFGEIMYHPQKPKPEYLVVENLTSTPFDMAEWEFTAGVRFRFASFTTNAPAASFLGAHERMVVCAVSEAAFRAAYAPPASLRVFGPWKGHLAHEGERITLRDKNGTIICSMKYRANAPWPRADGTGHSLVLKNPNGSLDEPRNWTASPALIESIATRPSDANRVKDGPPAPHEPLKRNRLLTPALSSVEEERESDTLRRPPAGGLDFLASKVVINEIMFDAPGSAADGEYVELFNRGESEMDLSGWRFEKGIQFHFPRGTRLPAGGYLVIARNAAWLREVYGELPVAGDFQGRLRNGGEWVRLVDAAGKLQNQVEFRSGGEWPMVAHSGTSLELINPAMDNRLPSAWRASDESLKAPWHSYACTNVYRELNPLGQPSDYRELHLALAGRGHVALRNLALLNGATNCLVNALRISTNGAGDSGWLCQGTHWASFVTNGEFHLVSDGRGDDRANRVELDVPNLEPDASYVLQFEARWISGAPRLIAQSWDRSIAHSFLLARPLRPGTPGRPNSISQPFPAPQVDSLRHSPAVPRPGERVKVTARVWSATPLEPVELWHRPDSADGTGKWQRKPMSVDGVNAGDGIDSGTDNRAFKDALTPALSHRMGEGESSAAGGAILPSLQYTAELDQYTKHGQIVQFFVLAKTRNGQTATAPRAAPERAALLVVDERELPRDLRMVRLVLSVRDLAAMAGDRTAGYGFGLPRPSSHYFNATVIMDEAEICYGAEVRNSGSLLTRTGMLRKPKVRLPDDQPFRGRTKFVYDDDAAGGAAYHNRLTRYLLYLLGQPANENEFVRVVVNDGPAMLREETEPVDHEFLNRNFAGGSHGELYHIAEDWSLMDNWEGVFKDADWAYEGRDDAAAWRNSWPKRTRETEDDYSKLMELSRVLAQTNAAPAEVEKLLDTRAALKQTAVRGYVGDWDTFTMQRGRNGFLYRRPNDGKFQFLHWDGDEGFVTGQPFYGERVKRWVEQPQNLRVLYYYLLELVNLCSRSPERVQSSLKAERDAAGKSVFQASYINFFKKREAEVLGMMEGKDRIPFEGKAQTGGRAGATGPAAIVSGQAPYTILELMVEGHTEARVEWVSDIRWDIRELRLAPGETELLVKGVDDAGRAVAQCRISTGGLAFKNDE